MAEKRRVVVVGRRGVFGSLLVRELSREFEIVENFRGAYAVACAAGPFQKLDRGMVREAVEAGAHWLDIADDAGWFFDLLDDAALNEAAINRGVAVIPGLSSLPTISGALVRKLGAKKVAITLEINNANRKGAAAMASATNGSCVWLYSRGSSPPPGYGVSRLTGMWVCSGKKIDSKPRSSASRATRAGAIV